MPGAEPKEGEGLPRLLTGVDAVPTCGKWGAEADNIYGLFCYAAEKYPANKCFGKRTTDASGKLGEFEFITFKEVLDQVKTIGSAFAETGLTKGSTAGIWSVNRMEWMMTALGMWSQGMTLVPLYDTLGDQAIIYEFNHADLSLVVCENSKLGPLSSICSQTTQLKNIVHFDALAAGDKAVDSLTAAGLTVSDMASFTALGLKTLASHPPSPASPNDIAYIMYTSGTTGNPKGVCLAHLGLCISATYGAGLDLNAGDSYLSYLPLAHIFETVVEMSVLGHGGCVGYYSGNIKLLMEDIAVLKPTLFVGVPRIFQRVYDKVQATVDGGSNLKKAIFKCSLSWELAARKKGKHSFLLPITKSVRAALGGNVRIIISGAAPLPSHVQEFLTGTMGCAVLQGYGMTENSANSTIAAMDNATGGHVGPPQPTCAIKLVDVPEMNYSSKNDPPAGEVLTYGKVNMTHYHKDEEATNATLEPDGWLHTGDIGRWNADGTLSIIDRKKNIFKLGQGEYVAVEKIEMALSKSAYIGQIWVYGNSFFTQLVTVVAPDPERLNPWAKQQGIHTDNFAALCEKPQVKSLIMAEIKSEAAAVKLKGFEVPKDVFIDGNVNELMQAFSVENDCLTPTFKLKRPQLLKRYKEQVDAMYTGLGEDISKAS